LDDVDALRLSHRLRSGERGGRHGGIRTINQKRDLRGFTFRQIVAIAGGNDDTGAHRAAIQQVSDFAFAADVVGDAKIIGRAIRLDELAALRRAIRVVHRRVQPTNVGRRRIAQQNQLDDGDDEHDGKRARIAQDVDEFFANDREEARVH